MTKLLKPTETISNLNTLPKSSTEKIMKNANSLIVPLTDISNLNFINCSFKNCNLSNCKINNAKLQGVEVC